MADNSQWGAAASGAGTGAAAGATVGSVIPVVGTAVGGAVGAVVGGVAGFFLGGQGEGAASTANTMAGLYNASMSEIYGAINAKRTLAAAKIGADMALLGAEIEMAGIEAVTMNNLSIMTSVLDYNKLAYEKEEEQVWEAYELDSHQRDILERKTEGTYQALSASSGVEMGNEGDSNTLGLLDMKTQFALDQFVIKRNAHIQVGKIQDAYALGEWEGTMEMNKIAYEGKINAVTAGARGVLGAATGKAQGIIDASAIMDNSKMRSAVTQYEAKWGSDQLMRGGDQALGNGILTGMSTVARTYAGSTGGTSNPGTGGGTTISGYNARTAHNYNASGNSGVGTYFKG